MERFLKKQRLSFSVYFSLFYSENKQGNQLQNRWIKSEKISKKVKSLNRQEWLMIFMLKIRVTTLNPLFSTRNSLFKKEVTRRTCKDKMTSFSFQKTWTNEAALNNFPFSTLRLLFTLLDSRLSELSWPLLSISTLSLKQEHC